MLTEKEKSKRNSCKHVEKSISNCLLDIVTNEYLLSKIENNVKVVVCNMNNSERVNIKNLFMRLFSNM